jgi:hypothetical protein
MPSAVLGSKMGCAALGAYVRVDVRLIIGLGL